MTGLAEVLATREDGSATDFATIARPLALTERGSGRQRWPSGRTRASRSQYITIANPDRANVIRKATSDELARAFIDVWEDRGVRVAILTREGYCHFCAGHNLAFGRISRPTRGEPSTEAPSVPGRSFRRT